MEATALESVDDLTPEWTTAVLAQNGIAATACRVTTVPVGNGQMGSCYRLFIDYEAGDGPDRLIVKLPATDAASRAAGQLGYRCETTFYREVANRVHLDIPRCYFAAMNECGDGFTLVLEDLAPALAGDQIAGCSVDQARAAAVNVAGLHAPTWNDPSLSELDWLIPDLAAYPEVAAAFLVDATKQFLDRYAVTRDTASTLQSFADRFVEWATGRPEPFAMLHSDYRLDNLLFAPSDASRPVVAVDWQVVTVGSPLRDVAFLVATGLSSASRRAGEKGIVEAYHRRLVALGVDGYGAEKCWEDYRYGLFQGPLITVLGSSVAQPTARGDRMFTVMAERSSTAISDLDAMSLL
ncbi:phosphotransferase [Mycobacterium paraintracellulare]|uniref:ecdysteroid 22-kinase family protein n=1 Tax=Mycobacterium paraintracellulare TaxID=1138383 RepID=UPI001EEF11F9|nr:ecdysteroid 22-kinase family protein [Mycobacterium paraintracellulare]WVL47973.1 phosphotransferase [Mycobacterium paraintracellulare]